MKAITYSKYGLPEVLKLKEVAQPVPKENELLIRVKAAEVTKADCELRSFKFPVKWFWLPLRIAIGITGPRRQILGGYFAGEIVSVGAKVSKFAEGDQVFGCAKLRMGTYAEYLCLPDNYTIVVKPHNLSFEGAAAVPLGGLNALHFLRKANIQEGEKVLINGAGGSIGTFAVQIAKSLAAEVTAVDSGIKEEMIRKIGADHFINYQFQDFTRLSQKYDVILDMVAKSSYSGCVRALTSKGRYLMVNPRFSNMFRSAITSNSTSKEVFFAFAGETEEELVTLRDMIEQDEIKPTVDKIFLMDQAAEAHRMVETEQRLGSIVLTIDH
jgi:NADPH:quinone reductase-like Zn-dependent oxidoreductase